MGMYDTIWVKCPKCAEESGFQTKSGDCILGNYTLDDCPADAMVDANRHSPTTCDCGAVFKIDTATRRVVTISA